MKADLDQTGLFILKNSPLDLAMVMQIHKFNLRFSSTSIGAAGIIDLGTHSGCPSFGGGWLKMKLSHIVLIHL